MEWKSFLLIVLAFVGDANAKCYFDLFENDIGSYSVKSSICFAPQQDGSGCINAMASYDYYRTLRGQQEDNGSHVEKRGTDRFALVQVEARYGCLEKKNNTDSCAILVNDIDCQKCHYNIEDNSITIVECSNAKAFFPPGIEKQTIQLVPGTHGDPYFKLANHQDECFVPETRKLGEEQQPSSPHSILKSVIMAVLMMAVVKPLVTHKAL